MFYASFESFNMLTDIYKQKFQQDTLRVRSFFSKILKIPQPPTLLCNKIYPLPHSQKCFSALEKDIQTIVDKIGSFLFLAVTKKV